MTEDKFSQITKEFVSCLTKNGVIISPKIEIADFRKQNQGRGIIALETINKDEVVFTLPKTAILNHETCEIFNKLDQKNDLLLEKYSQWEILIICLFYEIYILKEVSKFFGYFQTLPKENEFQNLIFWNDKELNLLKPSLIVNKIGKKESDEMFIRLRIEGFKDFEIEKYIEIFTEQVFHRLASLIQSYSFDVDSSLYKEKIQEKQGDDDDEEEQEEQIKAMVCLADTLNADTHLVNANLIYDEGCLKMKAIKTISKGSQVYNTYGEHSNAEILRRYGYVEWGQNGSKYDFGEIPLSLIKQIISEKYNLDIKVIEEILQIVGKDPEFNENIDLDQINEEEIDEDNDIINESYECFADGEIASELFFLIQILTSVGIIEKTQDYKYTNLKNFTEKTNFIKRFTKKILQLVNSTKITLESVENYRQILNQRIEQYDPVSMSVTVQPNEITKESMANVVLFGELSAIKSCLNYFNDKNFSIVEDDKLIRNLLKKYLTEKEEPVIKRRKFTRRNKK